MALVITKAFRFAFEGHYVQVTMKDVHAYILEKSEEGEMMTKGAAIVAGYFLDWDECFLYLGSKDGEIEEAVSLESVVHISKQDILELSDKDAAFFSMPEKPSEVN